MPDSAAEGLCPRCLLAAAATATEAGQTSGPRPSAPPLERVAAAFPQLEILELIGTGGMGAVFKARQPKLDRFVALKVLPESLARDPAFAERFQREGRLLARLSHPNIVSVHDFGQSGGLFYLLMEYVDGVNLRQAMQAGRFTPSQALGLVPRICEALQFAHDEGVLHRDIKPENILLDARGRVKIADFGVAKLLGEPLPEVSLTGTGAAVGTPHYMAPEQIEHPSDVDHRADIYSLGVVFYELLTGELPLGRFSPPSAKIDLDARIDAIVLRALTKERELRQQSAHEVKTEVEGLTGRGVAARTARSVPLEPSGVAPLWRVPQPGRQLILALLILLWVCLVSTLIREWGPWWGMILSFLRQGRIEGVCTGAGLLGTLWLGVRWWSGRAAWLTPLGLPSGAAGDGTNRWLQALLLGVGACAGINLARLVLLDSGLLGQSLANRQFGHASVAIGLVLVALIPLIWLLGREARRPNLIAAAPLPAWAHRVAVALLVAALASALSIVPSSGSGHLMLIGYGEFLVLVSIALWTGSRIWRAAALALNAVNLLTLPGAVWFLARVLLGGLEGTELSADHPLALLVARYPLLLALSQLLGLLAMVAGLAALLHPEVRATFGLPPRRGGRSRPADPALAAAA